MNAYVKETVKNALILFGITLLAGILVGAVYEVTKSARDEQKEKAKKDAYSMVVAGGESFEALTPDMNVITELLKKYGITEKNAVVDECVRALDKEKNTVGYIVSTTSKEGYGGNISVSVGFDLSGKLTGVSILSINETAGLGMEAKEDYFLKQYSDVPDIEPADGDDDTFMEYIVNKPDSKAGYNIDALSGATITSKAMTKAVNAAKITADYLMAENVNDTSADVQEGGEADE